MFEFEMAPTALLVPVFPFHPPGTTIVPFAIESVPAPVVVNGKLPDPKLPVVTKENVPCAPRNVPVPEVMFAVPEKELEDEAVAVALAVRVLPSPNVISKATAIVPAPPSVPVTEIVVAP